MLFLKPLPRQTSPNHPLGGRETNVCQDGSTKELPGIEHGRRLHDGCPNHSLFESSSHGKKNKKTVEIRVVS